MLDQQLDEQSLESVSPLAIAPSNLPPPIAPSSYSLSLDASPTPSTPLNADLIPELSLAIATANFTGRELSFAELLQARSAITELYTKFSARVDWGIPLVDVDSGDRTWQENGIYLSLRYTSF
ncbi:MAG: hypothetical protein MUF49_11455 [Oculatellaceae cyanobacterium Prado106]|nr:hypothetical protein [Oculatellaceae cyanobacterium Prado106]